MKPSRSLTCLPWVGLCLLLLTAGTLSPASAETLERSIACPRLTTSTDETGRWAQIDLPDGEVDVPFGAPAVPSLRLKLALPEGLSVQGVSWEIDEQQTLTLPRTLRPYPGEQASTQAEPPTVAPDPAFYGSSELYPAEPVRLVDVVELSNGARFAVVTVYPVRVRPALDEITWAKRGRLILTLGAGPGPGDRLPRLRETMRAAGIGAAEPSVQGRLLLAERGLARTETPSIEGTPIVFAIIAPPDEGMAEAWQPLADWKTACGYPAAVFTTDWIDAHYPAGADGPERIRMFLRDAYLHLGLTWALIGADPSLIPVRYARTWAYVPTGNGTDIATDYYYACLEGNWDRDGDGVFGESKALGNAGDYSDLTPEIEVGRVSARSAAEVNDFLEKYFVYTRTPATDGYLDRVLLLGEVLFHAEWTRTGLHGGPDCEEGECQPDVCRRSSDGQLICVTHDGAKDVVETGDQLRDSLGLGLERRYLLERYEHWTGERPDLNPAPQLESSDAVITRMSEGFGFVHHMGHGDRDRWAVGDGRIQIGQLSTLTNGNTHRYFWTYGINCSSAAIDFDSFGERMVMIPDQGAVAYLGCTNADFPSTARSFARDFYDFLFGTPGGTLGDGHFGSMGSHALTGDKINDESIFRFLIYAQILLGDPGMSVWRQTPTALATELVDHTNHQVPLGETTLRVSVKAGTVPVEGARVCVHKEGEVYAVGLTAASGEIELPFWPESQGSFTVTATAPDHLESSLNGTVVAATLGSALVVDALGIVDDGTDESYGNANGAIEVGETIRVPLTLENVGVATATGVTATLAVGGETPAGFITVIDGDAALAAIPAGTAASDTLAFLLQFAAQPPEATFGEADRIRLPLDLTLSSDDGSATLAVYLDLTRARLGISVNQLVNIGGQNRKLWLGVQNNGQGATPKQLLGKLTTEDMNRIIVQTPSVTDSTSLAPGDTALVGPFRLRVIDAYQGRLNFYLIDTAPEPDDTLYHRRLDVQSPGAPDSLTLTGLRAGMNLKWKAPVDLGDGTIFGYKIYRIPGTGTQPFPEVTQDIIEGHRFFTDVGLAELSKYSYYVTAVDGGGNLGTPSVVQSAFTSPGASPGWPHLMEEFTKASPLICELDGATSRGREILFSGDCIYAFHGDGNEMNDGDKLDRTSGPFGVPGPYDNQLPFWAKPAAADIDNDGAVEVLAISFPGSTNTNRGQLLCWPTWGGTPKWSVTFPAYWRSWTSPVLADLNGDDRLEIIFCGGTSGHAGIYVFQSDGTPWVNSDSNGRLKDLSAVDLYQTPAVGDVDGDGLLDITVATRTSDPANGALWVLKANGEPLTGFNNLKFSTLGSPPLAQNTTGSPTLSNVDGIPGDEIFVLTTRRLWCFKKNGALAWGPLELGSEFNLNIYEILPEPALGYIVGDGQMNVAFVDAGGKLRVLRAATGVAVTPFPVSLDATVRYGSCILANVDNDVRPDIIFGDSKGRVHAYRYDGQPCAGFPINSGGDMVRQSLAAWDVDKDGYQNLVIQANNQQQLSVLDISGVTFPTDETDVVRRNPWPMRRRDACNTGRYTTSPPVPVQLVLETPTVTESGQVLLAWTSGEPAYAFRIRRSAESEGAAELVGEVAGGSGGSPQRYAFRDTPPAAGTYVYHVNPVQLDGVEAPGPMVEVTVGWTLPLRAGLQQVAPDPLPPGGVASIAFGVPGTASSRVPTRLKVFDVQGRCLRTLVDEPRPAGVHVISWDGRDDSGHRLATGLYLLRMEVRGIRSERRLLVIR